MSLPIKFIVITLELTYVELGLVVCLFGFTVLAIQKGVHINNSRVIGILIFKQILEVLASSFAVRLSADCGGETPYPALMLLTAVLSTEVSRPSISWHGCKQKSNADKLQTRYIELNPCTGKMQSHTCISSMHKIQTMHKGSATMILFCLLHTVHYIFNLFCRLNSLTLLRESESTLLCCIPILEFDHTHFEAMHPN